MYVYPDQFIEFPEADRRLVFLRLPSPVEESLFKLETESKGRLKGWVAGGFIRAVLCGETPRDADLFFNSADASDEFCSLLKKADDRITATRSKFGWTLTGGGLWCEVQACRDFTFQNPKDLIIEFDYTICMAAMGTSGGVVYKDFYNHMVMKRLVYNPTSHNFPRAVRSLVRAFKFCSMGYQLDRDSTVRLLGAVHAKILEDARSTTSTSSSVINSLVP